MHLRAQFCAFAHAASNRLLQCMTWLLAFALQGHLTFACVLRNLPTRTLNLRMSFHNISHLLRMDEKPAHLGVRTAARANRTPAAGPQSPAAVPCPSRSRRDRRTHRRLAHGCRAAIAATGLCAAPGVAPALRGGSGCRGRCRASVRARPARVFWHVPRCVAERTRSPPCATAGCGFPGRRRGLHELR